MTFLTVFFDGGIGFPHTEVFQEDVASNLFQRKREYDAAWRKTKDVGRDKVDAILTITTHTGAEFTLPVTAKLAKPTLLVR
jgi:hypothetical protein